SHFQRAKRNERCAGAALRADAEAVDSQCWFTFYPSEATVFLDGTVPFCRGGSGQIMDAIRTTSAFFRESFRKGRWSLAKLAIRGATKPPPMQEKSKKILIISPGGFATTPLLEYISRHVRTNCSYDTDGLKHLPFPPHWLEKTGQKVLFISGDVESIRRSI